MTNSNYNPDELILSKQDILDLIDAVNIFWKKNPKENAGYIVALKLMKTGMRITPEKAVKKIWNTFLKFITVVQYENAIQSALNSGESWADTLVKIKVDIAKDGIDAAMEKYSQK